VREKAQGSLQPGQEGPLRGRLFGGGGFGGFGGGDQQLIASHAHWATILEYVVFVFAIVLVLALAAAVTVLVAVAASPAAPILFRYFGATWHSFVFWLTGLFK